MARKSTESHRSPEHIERELEATREEMSRTLDAIESRMTPGQLLDQSLDYLREGAAGDYMRNMRRTATDNPVPLTLVGIGLAWLALSGRSAGAGGEKARGRMSEAVHGAGESVQESMHRMREGTGAAVERIRHGAANVSSTGSSIYERARAGGRGLGELFQEHPLIIGIATAAAGALVGATALPGRGSTEESAQTTRDTALRRAERAAAIAAERKARETAEAAPRSGGVEPSPPPSASEVISDATSDLARAAGEAAARHPEAPPPTPRDEGA